MKLNKEIKEKENLTPKCRYNEVSMPNDNDVLMLMHNANAVGIFNALLMFET